MKVAFSELTGNGVCFKLQDDGWLPIEGTTVDRIFGGTVAIRRTGDLEVEVIGSFSVRTGTFCDRCGKFLQIPLESEFVYECVVGSEDQNTQKESECREEDLNRIYLEESVVDIGEILREQILLTMPLRNLCDESCRGLCPECGANLNNESCTCDKTEISSPFSILRKFKGR